MRLLFVLSMMAFILYDTASCTEPDNFTCGTSASVQSSSQTGGLFITSLGTLKVLVVFVRFKDDTDPNPWWPVGGNPIDWDTWIDPNTQTGSTHEINLTNYYQTMSLGAFNVIGQAVSVETPRNKSDYGSDYYTASKEVLQQKVDPLINFSDYDNWTYDNNYQHTNAPDGKIDMIIMIWRASANYRFSNWSGEASLGYGTSYSVENGTKTIATNFYGGGGSGVTVHYWDAKWPKYTFHAAVHEVAHWLLGGGHPYNNYNHSVWGMLVASSIGLCANTYEREKLAWIYPTPITEDILNAPLDDYITTGDAYKYHPLNGGANEYYYFENHQKLNIYDDATVNSTDKGIFVIHQGDSYQNGDIIRVKTSNGQWNWSNPSTGLCSFYGSPLPNFIINSVNRNGNNNRDKLTDSYGNADWIFVLNGVCGGYNNGENTNNSFNLTYNNVFSSYSNPSTHTWNNIQNNFTMEITGTNGNIVNARYYLSNPTEGKPSKPQNISVISYGGNRFNPGHPKISWDSNIEPDMQSGSASYEIYRSTVSGSGSLIATVPYSQLYYIDNDVNVGSGGLTIYYHIKAKDTQSLQSVFSDEVNIGSSNWQQKRQQEIEQYPDKLFLSQNFPNPFNPSTTIRFELPEDMHITLKIYDVLGKEIRTIVNEYRQRGYYEEKIDASLLSNGLYVYRLIAGNNYSFKKMMLIK
jgi:hypothetical protein